ncbi:MAG TPA: hypothetical protein VGO13_12010 [Solirubrobacterales bacterium]|nr:hypothetical protein [Solirubrobacterales bacterium]
MEGLRVEVNELGARVELRRQVGHLERELAGLFADAFGRVDLDHRVAPRAVEPRILDLGELECLRDELSDRVAEARIALRKRARVETDNRELLRKMLAAPENFKWVQVSRADIGEPGCGHWHSRPRLGPIGMLMGWWRVKVSSGCPLAGRLAAVEQEAQGKATEAGDGDREGSGQRPEAGARRHP